MNDNCQDCGLPLADVQEVALWRAGGARIGDYHAEKTTALLCEHCAERYTVCERCGDLIGDEVAILPGDCLCLACIEQGAAK